jgi:4-amino-4-deoxy-L-arabinose transferase-like glycosyltransferase
MSGACLAERAVARPTHRPPGPQWPPELIALIVAVASLNAFGITWGLPNAGGDWAIDSIAPLGPLQYAQQMLYGGHWWSKYPPLHFTFLAIVYAPYAAFLTLTGALDAGTVRHASALADPEMSVTLFTLTARVVSAAMGVGVAVVAYRIGVELAGRLAGVLAAVLFACSPLAVYYADAANLEMPYLFWSSLALLSLVRIARGAPRATYVRLGVFTAAAIATKDQAYGLFLLLPLPLAVLHVRGRGIAALRDDRLLAGAGAAVLTYLVGANVLVDPRGWLAHLYYVTHDGSRPYQMYPATVAGFLDLGLHVGRLVLTTATPPVVLLAAGGVLALRGPARRGGLVLGCAAVSYLATFIAPILYVFPRFVLPLVFVTTIFAGVGGSALWRCGALAGRAAVAASVAIVFVYGTSMNLGLVWDSRYAAEAWLAGHVEAGALVGTNGEGVYLPRVPADLRTVPIDVTSDGLRFVGDAPEYLIFSDAYYARYLRRAAVRPAFLALLAGGAGYEPAATFQSRHLVATSLIPTMNPKIVVLRRVRDSGGGDARGLLQLAEGGFDGHHEVVQIGNQVPIGDEAPAQPARVAEEGDAERLVGQQRQHRVALPELGAEEVERDLRAGDVGDDEVERP